jgi:hypothetical protein
LSREIHRKISKVAFTYDNGASFDGTGAQIQRILGIYAICKRYNIPYVHSGIGELIITPLDPFQTEAELKEYTERVNNYFTLPSNLWLEEGQSLLKLQTLTKSKVFGARVRNKTRMGRRTLFAVANPFQILNRMPNIYTLAAGDLVREKRISAKKNLILHYRRGSNTLDILPGESASRGLSNEWYIKTLRKYVNFYQDNSTDFNIKIYTDMPKSTFTYRPKDFQSHLWSYEPRYKEGEIEIVGEDIKNTLFAEFGADLTVYHGGDPLQGIIEMSEADILITSRSSYSYVGGLLNRTGKVIMPPEFWHRKLDSWILEP